MQIQWKIISNRNNMENDIKNDTSILNTIQSNFRKSIHKLYNDDDYHRV